MYCIRAWNGICSRVGVFIMNKLATNSTQGRGQIPAAGKFCLAISGIAKALGVCCLLQDHDSKIGSVFIVLSR